MAAIPVTIIGVLTYSGLEVGGGPMPGGPEATHPIAPGGPPPQIWPSPGHPAHPISPGGPPPSVWPGPGVPTPPIYYPPGSQPPYPSQGPGFPTPPIYIPITPPPDSGLSPTHPIYVPVYPTHPIANVPTWEDIKDFLTGNPPPARPHPEAAATP